MTISPIGTTCFGWLDVFNFAEKLSIVQFSLQVWAIIANIVNPYQYQQPPWWAFAMAFLQLVYFFFEYYGIHKKIIGLINFCCNARVIGTLIDGILLSILAYDYFYLGLDFER